MLRLTERVLRRLTLLSAAVATFGCADATAPATGEPRASAVNLSPTNAVSRLHVELDWFDNLDFPLSCVGGQMTHWEGPVHFTLDALTGPSGITQERLRLDFGPGYFVRLADGTVYYPQGPFPIREHHTLGPRSLYAGTAAGAWRSASGDVLVLGFHVQVELDAQGNVVEAKWVGACP